MQMRMQMQMAFQQALEPLPASDRTVACEMLGCTGMVYPGGYCNKCQAYLASDQEEEASHVTSLDCVEHMHRDRAWRLEERLYLWDQEEEDDDEDAPQ